MLPDEIRLWEGSYWLDCDMTVDASNASHFPLLVDQGNDFHGQGHTITVRRCKDFKGLFILSGGRVRDCLVLFDDRKDAASAEAESFPGASAPSCPFIYSDTDRSAHGIVENCHLNIRANSVNGGLVGSNAAKDGVLTVRNCSLVIESARVEGGVIGCRLAAGCNRESRLTLNNVQLWLKSGRINGFIVGPQIAHGASQDGYVSLNFNGCWAQLFGEAEVDEFSKQYQGSLGTGFNRESKYSILVNNYGSAPQIEAVIDRWKARSDP